MRSAGFRVNSLYSHLKSAALCLFFPQMCIHCKSELSDTHKLLCPTCTSLLEFLQPQGRCHSCFKECLTSVCDACQQHRPSTSCIASCFEYEGPAKSLIAEFKYNDRPYLASSLASFLFLQHAALGWPAPDLLTFVPQSFLKAHVRGYNQSKLLADELAKFLSRPVRALLKKRQATFSQSLLDKAERKELSQNTFTLTLPQEVQGKQILLIDDVYTTGTTIRRIASCLQEGHPASISVLTICRVSE